MLKLLILMSHCSTGGMPQFTFKKIEALQSSYFVKVIEYQNLSDHFVVQKNRIKELVGKHNFVTLGDDKTQLLKEINLFQPDVISFEEIPELFCDFNISKQIYNDSRSYKILETTHNSEFDPIKDKIFLPDAFVFVSQYSAIRYAPLGIPTQVIEYPVDKKAVSPKEQRDYQRALKLDQNKKHVIVVGLFTPRKNQQYAFELARQLVNYPIEFHFLGNLADNFKFYWEPLLKNKPANCVVHGETNKVNDFLKAGDLFLFPSLGNNADKELQPIAIKEALANDLKLLMFPLDVYLQKYDNHPDVALLNGSLPADMKSLLNLLDIKENNIAIDSILDQYVDLEFNAQENKLFIKSRYSQSLDIAYCVVKESNSKVPIYYVKDTILWSGGHFWVIPINNFPFNDDIFCGGFVVEFYDKEKNLFFNKTIEIKTPREMYKPVHLPPFDCLYMNYREFFGTKVYDDFIQENLNVVIDVGANCGLFTQLLLQKKAKKIYSIEPVKTAYENIKLLSQDYPQVNPLNFALDSVSGQRTMSVNTDNTTVSRFGEGDYCIDTLSWNDFINQYNIQKIDFLKMDIEAAEYDLIESMSDDHFKNIENILIEFHENTNNRLDSIIKKLEKNNFILNFRQQGNLNQGTPNDFGGILFGSKKKRKVLPARAIVSFCDKNYLPLAEKLVQSVSLFSKLPIILVGINTDIPFGSPGLIPYPIYDEKISETELRTDNSFVSHWQNEFGVINKKIDIGAVQRNDKNTLKLLSQKFKILLKLLDDGLEEGIFLDADGIINSNFDTIIKYFSQITSFPLATRHIHAFMMLNGKGDISKQPSLEYPLMNLLNVNWRADYLISSNIFLFNKTCRDFFKEALEISEIECLSQEPERFAAFQDETIMNVLLWKHRQNNILPVLFYNYLDSENLNKFLLTTKTNQFLDSEWQYVPEQKSDVVYFHGCKNLSEIDKCLNLLKTKIAPQTPDLCLNHNSSIGLISYFDNNIQNIVGASIFNKIKYCNKHKYNLLISNENVAIKNPQWNAIHLISKYLQKYEYLFWIDMDALIMNFNKKVEDFIDAQNELFISEDPYFKINGGVFIIKNTPATVRFIQELLDLEKESLEWPYYQTPMEKLISTTYKNITKVYPQQVLNSFWYQSDPALLNQPFFKDWNNKCSIYKEDDFILHFAGIKNNQLSDLITKFSR